MSRGNWRILAAIGGLILVGAGDPPKQGDHAQQSEAAAQVKKAADTIASAISKAAESGEKDVGCEDRSDKRYSDLCAQWKAADAARDAANYALWTLLLSVTGTGLLVWTLWETRMTARRELRAYVSVQPLGLGINPETGYAQAEIVLKNGGNTPAYNVEHVGIVFIGNQAAAEHEAMKPGRKEIGRASPFTLQIGHELNGILPSANNLTKDDIAAIHSGDKSLFLFGFARYEDTFGVKRMTRFCFEAKDISTPSLDGESDMKWSTAPFHNDST